MLTIIWVSLLSLVMGFISPLVGGAFLGDAKLERKPGGVLIGVFCGAAVAVLGKSGPLGNWTFLAGAIVGFVGWCILYRCLR